MPLRRSLVEVSLAVRTGNIRKHLAPCVYIDVRLTCSSGSNFFVRVRRIRYTTSSFVSFLLGSDWPWSFLNLKFTLAAYKRLGERLQHSFRCNVPFILRLIFHKRIVVRFGCWLRGYFKLVTSKRLLLDWGLLRKLVFRFESEIGVLQVLIFLMLTTNLNERCLLLRQLFQWGFNCFWVLNVCCSPAKNAFNWISRGWLLLLWSLHYERLRSNCLGGWRFRSINCVFAVRYVPLSCELCKLPLTEWTWHSVVRSSWHLRCEMVNLFLGTSILHNIVNSPCYLDCLL